MTKQMAKRMKRLETQYRSGGRQAAPNRPWRAQISSMASSRGSKVGFTGLSGAGAPAFPAERAGMNARFLQRVRHEIARCEAGGSCASVVAVDFSAGDWTQERWMACLDALVSTLAHQPELCLTVDLLAGTRVVIFISDAWEGEAMRLVGQLRQALRSYGPAFGVCELAPGMGALELSEAALARAERASASSRIAWGGSVRRSATLLAAA